MILLEASVRILLLAALLLGALKLVRVRSSAAWHAAYALTLVGMLAMPLATSYLPPLPVALRSPTPGSVAPSLASTSELEAPVIGDLNSQQAHTTDADPGIAQTGQNHEASAPPSAALALPSLELIDLYYAGMLLFLLRLGLAWHRVRSMVRDRVPGPSGARVSTRIAVPVTVGCLKPTVLLPADWETWDSMKLAAVLTHEAAHARRRDPLTTMVSAVNKAIFWFHPLAWWIEHRLAALAEEAADDESLARFGDRERYALILVEMAGAVRANQGRLMVAMARSARVSRRVDRVLSGVPAAPFTRRRAVVLSVAAVILTLFVAACQLVERTGSSGDTIIAGQVLDAQTNQPVAGASVSLQPTRLPFADGTWDPRETSTGSDGHFQFAVRGPITYRLAASHPDYVAPSPTWDDTVPTFEAAAGQDPADTLLKIDPGFQVEGRVFFGATGEPATEVEVMALPPEEESAGRLTPAQPIKQTTTDSNGRFHMSGLPPGPYRIAARPHYHGRLETAAPGSSFQPVAWKHGSSRYPGELVRDVQLGPPRNVPTEADLEIEPTPKSSIHGRIVPPDGATSGSVILRLGPADTLPVRSRNPTVEATVEVGSEFRIAGIVPGSYRLSARTENDDPTTNVTAGDVIEVGTGPLEQDLVLRPPMSVAGRVVPDKGEIDGTWEVRATSQVLGGTRPPAEVQPDGSFVLEGLFPSVVQFHLTGEAARGYRVAALRVNGQRLETNTFDIRKLAPNDKFEILAAQASGRLRVVVVDGDRRVSEAWVRLVRQEVALNGVTAAFRLPGLMRTDDKGESPAFPVLPGDYHVIALRPEDSGAVPEGGSIYRAPLVHVAEDPVRVEVQVQ